MIIWSQVLAEVREAAKAKVTDIYHLTPLNFNMNYFFEKQEHPELSTHTLLILLLD